MDVREAIDKLNDLELREFALGHAMGALFYDAETVAPRDSRIPRGKTLGVLSEMSYNLTTGHEAVALLDWLLEHEDELNEEDRRRVRLREKSIRELRAIPVEEYSAFEALVDEAGAVWREAKNKSDYRMFQPYLQRLIDCRRRFAGLAAPDMDPYDYCLDQFEEGLTQQRCDALFDELRSSITPLLARIREAEPIDGSFLSTPFPIEKQRELSSRLMDVLGVDKNRCTIGEVEHPFTSGSSKYDARVTTHYYEDNFLSSMYSVVHECGHALYDMNCDDRYSFTGLAGGVSMGVHESQSRFFENVIGRSRQFVELVYPDIVRLCPALAAQSPEKLYRAANIAQPSLIRVEADELTYPLHIMVRYRMEKAMIKGEVPVSELPDMWNALYKEYLGIDVPDARRGILQDSHWSGGSIGYFPSYVLGSAYSAQLLAKMGETVDVYGSIASGDLSPVKDWLRDKIWRFGSLYRPTELMERAFGGPFDPKYYTDYLTAKFTEVYGL